MENIRTGSDFNIHMPSGFEVESANLHLPSEDHILTGHTCDGSLKDKLYHVKMNSMEKVNSMKSRSIETMNSMKRDLNDRIETLRPVAEQRVAQMRDGVSHTVAHMQTEMRSNPSKWAGIAAGAGLGLGIMGRIMRHRAKHHRKTLPSIVIIEGAC